MYPTLYKLIDNKYITDYKKTVGKRMTRVYYHLEPSGEQRLAELIEDKSFFLAKSERVSTPVSFPLSRTGSLSGIRTEQDRKQENKKSGFTPLFFFLSHKSCLFSAFEDRKPADFFL